MDNEAERGGGLYDDQGPATFEDCRFLDNQADDGDNQGLGGAVWHRPTQSTDLTFLRCNFNNNDAVGDGGGVYVIGSAGGGDTFFTNCLFYRNEVERTSGGAKGGGMFVQEMVKLTNCTFVKNKCTEADSGGGIYNDEGDSVLKNCILWRNKANDDHSDEEDQIKVNSGTLTVTNCCIEHHESWPGNYNVDTNPLFVDMSADNYVLLSTGCSIPPCDSDAIDESDNNVVDCNGGDLRALNRCVELEGHGAIADMGCYETQE